MRRDHLLWLAFGFEGGLALTAWMLGWMFGVDVWPGAALTGGVLMVGLVGTAPLLLGLAFVLQSAWPPVVRLREATYRVVDHLFANARLIDFIVVAALAGVGEEVFFRGFLQTGLAGWLGLVPAIWITGVLFGLAHAVTPAYVVYATIVGVYLGMLLPLTGSLWAPVVAHAAYDLVALLYVRRRLRGVRR